LREEQRRKTNSDWIQVSYISTLVERSVESPDTLSRDRSVAKQSTPVFNQLPRSRLEHAFGGRSALFSGVERGQLLEKRRNMTIDTGVQRMIQRLAGISQKDFVEVLSRFHREQ
jgi:hypothetical protein